MERSCVTCVAAVAFDVDYEGCEEGGYSAFECRMHPPPVSELGCGVDVWPVVPNAPSSWCMEWRAKPSERREPAALVRDRSAMKIDIKLDDEFERFWMCYPRKVGKKAALKAWQSAKDLPALEDVLLSLDRAKRSEQWQKDGGQFIPLPTTWINQGRWHDEAVERPRNTFESFLARGEHEHVDTTRLPERVALSDRAAVGEDLSLDDRDDANG